MSDADDDVDRDAILARRGRMISTAMAGLLVAACSGDQHEPEPQPCLSPPIQETAPEVCLSINIPHPEAADAGTTQAPADAGTMPSDAGRPQPCLSFDPLPDAGSPRTCLSVTPKR